MKALTSWLTALVVVPITLVAADWQYLSRPDLAPPKLNITTPARNGWVEEGYLFLAPYSGHVPGLGSPLQPTAYIFRDDGDMVWSGLGHFSGSVVNFGVDTWNGEQVLRAFQGQPAETPGRAYGFHVIMNDRYEIVKVVHGRSNKLGSAHEFQVINGTSALIEVGSTKPLDLSPWGGLESQNWIISTGFQEVDIETGKVLFEWESLDHVDPKLKDLASVDKDSEGNYIISARNVRSVYKINGTSGDIIWTLGGLHSSYDVEPNAHFAYQHDARLLNRSSDGEIETLSLFDNAGASPEQRISPFSLARIIQLNHTASTARSLHTYAAPDGLSVLSQGNTQVLPSGNVFVNWGQAGAISEWGDMVFHAYLDSAPEGVSVQNYHGFRSNWTGSPIEEPALLAVHGDLAGTVEVYVSWNGDTEAATWKFYAELSRSPIETWPRKKTLLGETRRTGFETRLRLDVSRLTNGFLISAQAVDAQNRVLVHSSPVNVQRDRPISPNLMDVLPGGEQYLFQGL